MKHARGLTWDASLQTLKPPRGVVVLMGPVDTGKSTWVRQYCDLYPDADIGLVSADLGQCLFGAPGLISYAPWDPRQPDVERYLPAACVFVGSTHPTGRLLQTVDAIRRVVRCARRRHATVLVDTDGLIDDVVGREYKWTLLMSLRPCTVVLLTWSGTEHPWASLLAPWADVELFVVEPHGRVRPKPPSERAQRRHQMFQRWFSDVQRIHVPIDPYLVSDCTGLGALVTPPEWDQMLNALGDLLVYAERTPRKVWVLTREALSSVAYHRLRETWSQYQVQVHPLSQWHHRLVGDVRPDGYASGMGRIVGWSAWPPMLEIEGRFLTSPGPLWVIGPATFPEVTSPGPA